VSGSTQKAQNGGSSPESRYVTVANSQSVQKYGVIAGGVFTVCSSTSSGINSMEFIIISSSSSSSSSSNSSSNMCVIFQDTVHNIQINLKPTQDFQEIMKIMKFISLLRWMRAIARKIA